ncbi:hypothetical protein [Gordonia cholesterolivorans]|uniref:Uncharacterized protein n=1 Tax=Gordonia cholesterolivorans TaxID=559625 RepID=A0ABN3HCT5_9ACTN
MSIDTLAAAIVDAAIAADGKQPIVRLGRVYDRWIAEASNLAHDVYAESGYALDRIFCSHVENSNREWAYVQVRGSEGESAEAVLEALLEFVRTETPVPA